MARRTEKDEQSRLFTHRNLREELEDARDKIEKLKAENYKKTKELNEKEVLYTSQISELEQKLQESEDLLRNLRRGN